MPISAEEIIKIEKDKDLEARFKSVKQAIRLNITRYLAEANNGNLLKYFSAYACDVQEIISEDKVSSDDRAKSVLCALTKLGATFDGVFEDVGDAKEGVLAHILSTKVTVKLDNVTSLCRAIKVNYYPSYVEKYSLGMSEDMEKKMIVPRSTLRAVKALIDRYYFMFRIVSINPTCRSLYNTLSHFRGQVQNFEWTIFYYMKAIQGEYLKESGNFSREIKSTLLNMKKLFEAIDSSNFAKLVTILQDMTRESGLRIFAKHNTIVTIVSNDQFKGQQIDLSKLLALYDEQLKPMYKIVSSVPHSKKGVALRMVGGNDERIAAYRKILPIFATFCESMKYIVAEFGRVMTMRTDEYKFFAHTLDTTVYPYFNNQKNDINDMFITAIKNLDTFFWKLMMLVAERSLEPNISLDEVFGLSIRVTKEDYAKYSYALTGVSDIEADDSDEDEQKVAKES